MRFDARRPAFDHKIRITAILDKVAAHIQRIVAPFPEHDGDRSR
jgi:hypothetical protein